VANYRIAPNALADLERIWLYGLEKWGEKAADAYLAEFFKHFENLAKQPRLYALSPLRKGYRRSMCGKESIYYRINGETVEIMAIIGRQDLETHL